MKLSTDFTAIGTNIGFSNAKGEMDSTYASVTKYFSDTTEWSKEDFASNTVGYGVSVGASTGLGEVFTYASYPSYSTTVGSDIGVNISETITNEVMSLEEAQEDDKRNGKRIHEVRD